MTGKHTQGLVAQRTDVEPHLRTDDEKRELFPLLELLSDYLYQTQTYVLAALNKAGLTVVPLDSSARETAPENPNTLTLARSEGRREGLLEAEIERSTLLWAVRQATAALVRAARAMETRGAFIIEARAARDTLAWLDGHDSLQIALSRSNAEDALKAPSDPATAPPRED